MLSGKIAAASAHTAAELQAIEIAKGILFVLTTGALFFLVSLARWRHAEKQEERIREQERLLLAADRKNIAALCTATLAHDLNNLLVSLSAMVGELKDRIGPDLELQEIRTDLERSIANMSAMAGRISSLAVTPEPERRESLRLSDAVEPLLSILHRHPDVRTCLVNMESETDRCILLNRSLLEDAVINLVINAAQASGPHHRIQIKCLESGDAVYLEVHDEGPGIPDASREKIFEPCYSTKQKGSGLGLLSVKAFAASCGGHVEVRTSDLGGACLRVTIPVPPMEAGLPIKNSPKSASASGG